MDLETLQRQATAAREFGVAVGSPEAQRFITLRLPTRHETRLASLRAGLGHVADGVAASVALQRTLLVSAVVGWSRVTVGDVLPESEQAAELLVYEPGAVALLLDAQPDWEEELGAELWKRMAERRAKQDTAEKNSAS